MSDIQLKYRRLLFIWSIIVLAMALRLIHNEDWSMLLTLILGIPATILVYYERGEKHDP